MDQYDLFPISFRIALLAMGQSCVSSGAFEATLTDVEKTAGDKPQHNKGEHEPCTQLHDDVTK